MKQIPLTLFLLQSFAFDVHGHWVLNPSSKTDINQDGNKETLFFFGHKKPEF
jgi:hypothetical protein